MPARQPPLNPMLAIGSLNLSTFGEPVGKAQITRPAAIEAASAEAPCAAHDQTVATTKRPAGRGAEIERKTGHWRR